MHILLSKPSLFVSRASSEISASCSVHKLRQSTSPLSLANFRGRTLRACIRVSPFSGSGALPKLSRGIYVRAVVAAGEDFGMKLEARADGDGRKSNIQAGDAVVIVDHGSRRAESNAMLHEFVELYKQKTGHSIVEPAHMELAEPSIANAFDRCVEQGATRVIISPYFLFPGRHWNKDIPALAAQAAEKHAGVPYIVTAPIGLHELMVRVLEDRMEYCLSRVAGDVAECDMCAGTGRCQQLNANPRPVLATSST